MRHRPLLLFSCLFLLLSGTAAGEESGKQRGSSLPRRCDVCHVERMARTTAGPFNFLTLRGPSGAGEEKMCYSCHNGPVRDSRRGIWQGRQHRADGPSVGPSPGVRASCGTCHDPHVQTAGVASFMRFTKGHTSHCLQCHPGRGPDRGRNHPVSSRAGERREGELPGCFSCHAIHGAPAPSLVSRRNSAALCSSCHGENPSTDGVGPGSSSHLVSGDGPACATCHAVHEAAGEKLLRETAASGVLCRDCHGDYSSREYGEGNHPFEAGRVDCLSCHRAHNAAQLEGRNALLARQPDSLDSVCSACHGEVLDAGDRWNHPVDAVIREENRARLAKFSGYGSLLGSGSRVRCLSCHRAHRSIEETAGLVVRPQALCLYCHREQNSLAPRSADFGTHPISVRPESASVSPLFLAAGGITGAGGEIMCLTCHRSHGGDRGLVLSRSEYSCTLCHGDKSSMAQTSHGRTVEAADPGGPADSPDPCRDCHGTHGWRAILDDTGMGGSAIEKVCWYCHGLNGEVPMKGFFGHILGAPSPRGTGGRDLPLFLDNGRRYKRGVITCATCHDVHRVSPEYSLRLKPGEQRSALCSGCHPRKEAVEGTKHDLPLFFPRERNRLGEAAERTGTCGTCHLAHSGGLGDSWARDAGGGPSQPGGLYPFCVTCHREGSLAQGKTVAEKVHPPSLPELQTPGGNLIDCGGCHDPHRWNPLNASDKGDFFTPGDNSTSFLVSPSSGSSPLCLKCHAAAAGVAGTPHDFTDREGGDDEGSRPGLCEQCHLPHGGQGFLMWPSPLENGESYGSEACTQCHGEKRERLERGWDHPIGVTPGPRAGNEFPLYLPSGRKYFQGNVSCGSCHDPHRWSPVEGMPSKEEGTSATSFLRLEADGYSPLCFPCHSDFAMVVGTDHDLRVTAPGAVNLDGFTAEESGVCGSCHSVHSAKQQPFLWNRRPGRGEDPQSRSCRSCHEEGGLSEAKVPPRLEAHLVSYPGKGMVSRFITRRQPRVLEGPRSLALYDAEGEKKTRGYISCATCHDPHRWEAETSRSGGGVPLEGDEDDSFLREGSTFAVGGSFCRECHEDVTLEKYRRYHFPEGEAVGEE